MPVIFGTNVRNNVKEIRAPVSREEFNDFVTIADKNDLKMIVVWSIKVSTES